MPGMSGFELQERLQRRNVSLPVIMVTARTEPKKKGYFQRGNRFPRQALRCRNAGWLHREGIGGLTGSRNTLQASSRQAIVVKLRDSEVKNGAVRKVRRCPNLSSVALYDRTADRQSHSHAAWLGCIEWIEKSLEMFGP